MKAFVRKFFDLPYRIKLLITHLGIVLLVVVAITAMITMQSSRQVLETSTASLVQLTEQVLINFTNAVQSAESHLYSMSVSSGSARQMGRMSGESALNEQDRLDLVYCLSKMIDLHATYDHVAVRLDSGAIVSSDSLSSSASAQSSTLLSDPAYQENRYGQTQWVRTASGDVWLLRDVYDTSPLRHVGKMCARMKQGELVSMGSYNGQLGCSVLFFGEDGSLIVGGGENIPLLAEAAQELLTGWERAVQVDDTAYAVCRMKKQGFTAVGFLPMKSVEALQASILRSGVVAALLGVLFGLIISIAVSGQMTGQIRRLVDSMRRVEAGELDVSTPVQSRDEIGVLTGQFNRMTVKTRELIQRLVEEENSKRLAQYQNLAYEYRFLHWQVNPHFIYNALETLNALAKIDGNDEMSDMIVMLSAYFRQNAEAMRKKFVTVEEEFSSLQQYADIYRCIYGSSLHAGFEIAPQAQGAFLPTSMIPPVLEYALVHGGGLSGARIAIRAQAEDGALRVTIEDNGRGMTQEMIDRLLGRVAPPPEGDTRTSLGVRNVLDRMHLIYGEAASMDVQSAPGQGTRVTIRLPLSFSEEDIPVRWEWKAGAQAEKLPG